MSRKLRIPTLAAALLVSASALALPPAAQARPVPTIQEALTRLLAWLATKPAPEPANKSRQGQRTGQGTTEGDIGCGIDPNGIPLCQP